AIIGSGAGILTLSNVFKPKYPSAKEPQKLAYKEADHDWMYDHLDPATTAELAYKHYGNGGCMYATFISVLSQLADKFGEPYDSFPFHMMKYGHGGIGGFGTTCGALNGAAALIGLFVAGKEAQDGLITGLFRWYENKPLPEFRPREPNVDFNPPTSIPNSTICHASNTSWVNASGYKMQSKERKERCRRLTSDVVAQLTVILNEYFSNSYVTDGHDDETVRKCMTCHGKEGKMDNTGGKMSCTSCHTESPGHKIFAEPHYKVMKEK
ncbi:MAG: C-GCAxxG-C-C family (seleno)protein, partial [Bacteroidota bacterium]